MSQQNFNLNAGEATGPNRDKTTPFMAGADRAGEGGGPQRGSRKGPKYIPTNVKAKPKKGGL